MIFPISGNKSLENTVKGLIASKRIPHAFIIEGDEGSGRHALKDYLAAALVCESENPPCSDCNQCHLAIIGNHTDIITVSPEDGKKNISVSQIRDVRADAFIKPRLQEKKIFIIDPAHRMNEQAQNALLKVLEEPPKNVFFILITPSRTLLLETVISRCTLLSLSGTEDNSKENAVYTAAQNFIDNLFKQNEYEMLKILQKYEKNRLMAEEFFLQLKLAAADNLKKSVGIKTKAVVLNALYNDADEYLRLLKTNINLSLLFTAVTAKSKSLTE